MDADLERVLDLAPPPAGRPASRAGGRAPVCGIASLAMTALAIPVAFGVGALFASRRIGGSGDFAELASWVLGAAIGLEGSFVVGAALGGIGCARRERQRGLALAGVIVNGLFAVGLALAVVCRP